MKRRGESPRGGKMVLVVEKAPSLFCLFFVDLGGGCTPPKNRPPFHLFFGPPKSSKIDPGRIFRGLRRGPKNGPPSRGAKSEILPLFTTLREGPGSRKGTPFRDDFGDPFSQKNEKGGVPEKGQK